MTTIELAKLCSFKELTRNSEKIIDGAFAGDLLSWAMSRVEENNVWFTVMGNINAVAVAALSDCSCIVLCHSSALAEDAKTRAEREGIVILGTDLTEYEAITAYNKIK